MYLQRQWKCIVDQLSSISSTENGVFSEQLSSEAVPNVFWVIDPIEASIVQVSLEPQNVCRELDLVSWNNIKNKEREKRKKKWAYYILGLLHCW